MGTLGDGHGRKRALEFGLSIFLVITILAGLSGTVQRLILLRGVMGIVAAHQFATYIPLPAVQSEFVEYVNDAFTTGLSDAMFAGAVIIALVGVLSYLLLPNAARPPKGGAG